MPKRKYKSVAERQHSAMWSLVKQNMTDSDFREWIFDLTNGKSESSSALSFEQKNEIINKFGGTVFTKSRRTENYHRAKFGNFDELLSADQKDKIKTLCEKGNITDARFAGISRHACNKDFPLTVKQGQKVIEALKNIIKREAANPKLKEAA